MIPRRVWVNLAAFLLLFAVLCNWAVRNVLSLDAIEQPYRITATFESSPGLRPNVEVTYLGVRVGTIDRLHLEPEGVVVELDIDRGTVLPAGLTAAVRRKSAVGEPYVALSAPEGYAGDGATVDPGEGYAIPRERTSVPLAYGELFTSLDDLIDAVDPDDFSTVVHELAEALGGRGPALRRLLENVDDAATTLAARADVFDALATDLTSLTHTIRTESDAVGASFDDLALLTGTLAASRTDVERLLAETPRFGEQVADLLEATAADLGCVAAGFGPVFATLGTPDRLAELSRLLDTAGPARDALDAALVETGEDGADGPYLGGSFIPEVAEASPPTYQPNPGVPVPPAMPECAGAPAGQAGASDAARPEPGRGSPGAPGSPPSVSDRPGPARVEAAASSEAAVDGDAFPTGRYLAGLALAALVVLVAVLRPWRFSRGTS